MVQLVLGEVGKSYIGKLSSFLKLFSVERTVVTNSLRTCEQAMIPRNFRWLGRIDQAEPRGFFDVSSTSALPSPVGGLAIWRLPVGGLAIGEQHWWIAFALALHERACNANVNEDRQRCS